MTTSTKSYNPAVIAQIRAAIDEDDGLGYGLIRAADLAEEHGAPECLLDHGVQTAVAHRLPCLAEHIAARGASQKCIEELYRWCVASSVVAPRHLRYAPIVAGLLGRHLAVGEVEELIALAVRYDDVGIMFPRIADLRGVSAETLEYLASECRARGSDITAPAYAFG